MSSNAANEARSLGKKYSLTFNEFVGPDKVVEIHDVWTPFKVSSMTCVNLEKTQTTYFGAYSLGFESR